MKETEKLRVLFPHSIEHDGEHAEEFRDWAERAGDCSEGTHPELEPATN